MINQGAVSVVFRRLPDGRLLHGAGSVRGGEPTRSVVVGHHDGDERDDVLRINKPATPTSISFLSPSLLQFIFMSQVLMTRTPGAKRQIMCCLRNMCEGRSFFLQKEIDKII